MSVGLILQLTLMLEYPFFQGNAQRGSRILELLFFVATLGCYCLDGLGFILGDVAHFVAHHLDGGLKLADFIVAFGNGGLDSCVFFQLLFFEFVSQCGDRGHKMTDFRLSIVEGVV